MNFKAAIFDLDGTLLQSMDIWEKIDIEFLSKRGLSVPDNYVTEICARSFEEAARYTIDLFQLPEHIEEILEEWNAMAALKYKKNVSLSPYAHEYLLHLKQAGIKLAVATALPELLYKPCLLSNHIYHLFDVFGSTEEVTRGKEYPDIYELVARKLQVPPKDCIVFEDVLPAVKSAKIAGMIVYGVYDTYSAHHKDEIKAIADGYLYDFEYPPMPNGSVNT